MRRNVQSKGGTAYAVRDGNETAPGDQFHPGLPGADDNLRDRLCSGPLELGTGVSNTRECCRPIERGYDDGETTIVQPAVQDRVGAGSVARSEDAGPDLSGT